MVGRHRMIPAGDRNYSFAQNPLPLVPMAEGGGLVGTDDQHQLGLRVFGLQLVQRVDGVARALAQQFAFIDLHTGQPVKGQAGHRQPVGCSTQWQGPMRRLPGGQHMQTLQAQLGHGLTRQFDMGPMRRVEGTAEKAQARRHVLGQIQSRGTRKCSVRRASGLPASGVC